MLMYQNQSRRLRLANMAVFTYYILVKSGIRRCNTTPIRIIPTDIALQFKQTQAIFLSLLCGLILSRIFRRTRCDAKTRWCLFHVFAQYRVIKNADRNNYFVFIKLKDVWNQIKINIKYYKIVTRYDIKHVKWHTYLALESLPYLLFSH